MSRVTGTSLSSESSSEVTTRWREGLTEAGAELVRREGAASQLGEGRHELARDAKNDLGRVGERTQDLVAFQERLPGQRRAVGRQLRLGIPLGAERLIRLVDHAFSFSRRSSLTTFGF